MIITEYHNDAYILGVKINKQNMCGEILGEVRNSLFFYFGLAIFLNVRSAAFGSKGIPEAY